jgi:chaperonin GroES
VSRTYGAGQFATLPRERRVDFHAGDTRQVHPLEKTEQLGSIVIPETSREKCLKGEVLKVGPGRWIDDAFHPTQVKEGQRVLLSPSINRNWPDIVEGSGIVMIQEADILGVLND